MTRTRRVVIEPATLGAKRQRGISRNGSSLARWRDGLVSALPTFLLAAGGRELGVGYVSPSSSVPLTELGSMISLPLIVTLIRTPLPGDSISTPYFPRQPRISDPELTRLVHFSGAREKKLRRGAALESGDGVGVAASGVHVT